MSGISLTQTVDAGSMRHSAARDLVAGPQPALGDLSDLLAIAFDQPHVGEAEFLRFLVAVETATT